MATVLSTRLKLWFLAAAVALVASFALRYVAVSNVVASNRQSLGIQQTVAAMDAVVESLEDAQAGATDYLSTGKEDIFRPYRRASGEAGQKLAQLTHLVNADPAELEGLARLRQTVGDKLAELESTLKARQADDPAAPKKPLETETGARLTRRAETIVRDMKAAEQRRLELYQKQGASAEQLNLLNFFGLAGFNLLLLGLLFYAVRLDASQRARAKAVLERQELRLRRVVESNVIGIVLADGNGRLFGANDAFLQMIGYTP